MSLALAAERCNREQYISCANTWLAYVWPSQPTRNSGAVCKHFKYKKTHRTNDCHNCFFRTQRPLSHATRMKMARNWLRGCYREQQYFHRSKMFATKLFLERNWLYLSYTCYLSQHRRLKAEALQKRYHHEIVTSNKTDIADFVKKGDTIFAGRVAGNSFIYEEGYATEQQLHNTNEYMWCVDFSGDTYVTSTNRCAKIWRRSEEMGLLHLDLSTQLNNSYKTLRFNESGNRLFGGLYTSTDRQALREIDLER